MVNNAGILPKPGRLHEADDDAFDKTMAVNARSVFLCSKYTIRQMLKQEPHSSGDRGWIVNVASIAGLVGVGPGKSFEPDIIVHSCCPTN